MARDPDRRARPVAVRATGAVDGWRVSFGEFALDTAVFELCRDGHPVHLEPQAFDVLAYLVRHRDRVVSKEELLDEVWGDRFVTESTLTSRVKQIRRALGDDGRGQRCIRTVHGRGYRFAPEAPVTARGADHVAGDGGECHGYRLPAERTPLFGRREAVASVAAAVRAHRLVSLCGIGGAGKSRLATAVGHRCRDGFPDGVWWVGLGSCDSTASVQAALSAAAGVPATEAARPPAWTLGSRRVLVVLDDAEHVRDELAAVLDRLLDHTAAPRFLVTSRVPLELPDERRIRVPPLPCDGTDPPAGQVLRAAAERFGRTLVDGDEQAVRQICDGLGGLPLAVELAAAALRVLTPDDLAARLGNGRLDLPARTGRARHGSLLAVLEDAWVRAGPVERELLVRLGHVRGEFDVADAERLAPDLPPGAVAAATAHLLDLGAVTTAAAGRFRLLEPMRWFVQRPRPGAALTPPSGRARPDVRTARARRLRPRRAGWTCAAG